MITPIQCATMHSGLTEQEVKEKYDWVLRALSEYGSRCVYDFLDGNSPEPAKHKPFIVGNVRDILDELKQEEITFNLFVEKLNAIARKFYEGASEGMTEAWAIEYDNDTGSGDEYFVEWFNVTNGEKSFRCNSKEDAEFLLASLSPGIKNDNKWIKIKENYPSTLPNNGNIVLCLTNTGLMTIGFIYKGVWERNDVAKSFQEHGYVVTHWRPLPAPPSNKNK